MPVTNSMFGGSVMWNMDRPHGVSFSDTLLPLLLPEIPLGRHAPHSSTPLSAPSPWWLHVSDFPKKKLAHSLSLERKEYISQISIFFSALLITYETRSRAEAKMLICEIGCFCQGRSVLQGNSRASLQGRSCHPPTPPSIGGRTEDTRCCLNIILLLLWIM